MRLIASVVAGVLLAQLVVLSAFAHAEPSKVQPGQDAVLTAAPTQVVIEMSQEMARQDGANDIVVQDESGKTLTTEPAVIDNADRRKLTVPLPAGLGPGTYTVRWRTLSADDGDTASGNYSFKVDPSGTANPGKEVLREDTLGLQTPASSGAAALAPTDSSGGTSWVLVIAVGVGMFVLGAGGSFLLVQKRA